MDCFGVIFSVILLLKWLDWQSDSPVSNPMTLSQVQRGGGVEGGVELNQRSPEARPTLRGPTRLAKRGDMRQAWQKAFLASKTSRILRNEALRLVRR